MCLIKPSLGWGVWGGGKEKINKRTPSFGCRLLLQPFTDAGRGQLLADGTDDDRSTVHAGYHIFNGINTMTALSALWYHWMKTRWDFSFLSATAFKCRSQSMCRFKSISVFSGAKLIWTQHPDLRITTRDHPEVSSVVLSSALQSSGGGGGGGGGPPITVCFCHEGVCVGFYGSDSMDLNVRKRGLCHQKISLKHEDQRHPLQGSLLLTLSGVVFPTKAVSIVSPQ